MDRPTPLVEVVPGVLSKLECMNPGGSHKTRAARYIVRSAIAAGKVRPGITTIIEKTGGNFGLGLALECQRHGVELELAVGPNFSMVKKRALQKMGAQLIGQGMMEKGASPRDVIEWHLDNAGALDREYYYTNQFANERCVDAHYYDTGPELSIQLHRAGIYEDQPLTFVSGAGTGATFSGVGRRLREEFPDLELVLVEPEGCSMRHDRHGEHCMEGIAVGVVPPFVEEAQVDAFMECTHQGMETTQNRVARRHGRFIGNSSAAILDAAAAYKAENPKRQVVTVVYDEGGWYI